VIIELSIAGGALVAALVLTALVAPQLGEKVTDWWAARNPEPDVKLPTLPAAAPMARRTFKRPVRWSA
jgi:hypothetical protein